MDKAALSKYYKILSGEAKPRFKSADLDSKIEEAERILESCELCGRMCGTNRLQGELGWCKVGTEWKIFGAHTHLGEEAELVPSATLFYAGCNMKCVYCFLPDTAIITNKGVMNFEELYHNRNNLGKHIKTIGHSGKWKKIKRVFQHHYEGNIISIKPFYFPSIKCTESHKFFISDNPQSENIEEIEANRITKKHFLVVPKIRQNGRRIVIDSKEVLSSVKPTKYKKSTHKLSKKDIDKILVLREKGHTLLDISRRFNLSHGYIRYLAHKIQMGYDVFYGDYKLIERNGFVKFTFEKGKGIPRFIAVTPSVGKLLGYFCGEGCITKCKDRPNSYRLYFSFGKQESKKANEAKYLLKRIFKIKPYIVKTRTTVRLEVGSSSCSLFFKALCGHRAEHKIVPECMLNGTKKSIIESFLSDYASCDGCITKDKGKDILSINTTSKKLAWGIFWLYLKVGKIPRFFIWKPKPTKKIENRLVRQKTIFYIKVKSENSKLIETKKYFFIPIREISKEKYSGPVYNMEVENDHSYLANFVAAKNCQNAPQSITPELGEVWSDEQVARWIDRKYDEGCKNVNFVSPDCYMWNILKILKLVKTDMPVVWNSNAYYSEKAAELLKGIVDVYLLDFRYFNGKCAIRLSSAPNYPEAAKRNHLTASRDAEMIIRVLVMPNHIECDAKPILKWIKENLGAGTRVNILAQYRPCWKAMEYNDIKRPISPEEYRDVVAYAKRIGLRNLV